MASRKLLVNADGVGGKEKVVCRVCATSLAQFLDAVAAAASVSREGLDFEIFDEDFQEWASVTDIAEIPVPTARVRLRREEPAAVPPPPEEDAVMEVAEPTAEDDEVETSDAAPIEPSVDAPASAEPDAKIPEEWISACEEANETLANDGVNVSLTLSYSKGRGSTARNGHRDLLVRCSACGRENLKTGGSSTPGCSLYNAMKHAREQHGPSSAEAHAKKLANATSSAAEPHGEKRSYAAAMSNDDGSQKTAGDLAKEKYDAAVEILAGFKGQGLQLLGSTNVICDYCSEFSTGLLQKNLRANLQRHVDSETHNTASKSKQSRLSQFLPKK